MYWATSPQSLLDLSAKIVAEHIPFQTIEQRYEHIPEPVQRRIIFWSFPRHEDDIKLYSSLSSDTLNANAVQDVLQVGFSLSGTVIKSNLSNDPPSAAKSYRVSVTFDRCKITSISCSCELQDIFWCEHVVALILYRIRNPETIDLRVPISETLSSLDRYQLQKLVQYIIAEHHTEVLPTAQRLLDEMTQSLSEINQIHGAPDPTAGACADDEHIWHLDEQQVNEKVQNYLNLVCSNSKDAIKQINALFEKIREMFRARDSNGTRLLKLITEQFLLYATRNEKSRPLWDQLAFLWTVVMLNPDLPKAERKGFVNLLLDWSKVPKCPKEDFERRIVQKRKAPEISDDEDMDEPSNGPSYNEYPPYNRSNNIPAHLANHRHQTYPPNATFPVLRPFNHLPSVLSQACACQLPHTISKKMRVNSHNSRFKESHVNYRPSTSSNRNQAAARPLGSPLMAEDRPIVNQEPRSVFYRALDFEDAAWDNPHLQMILNKDGPTSCEQAKSHLVDFAGNPLWDESISVAAARVETLRSHGYRDQALRLTVATVRRLKVQQDQWCLTSSPDMQDSLSFPRSLDSEGWIGHPFDPINVMVDLLLESSLTEGSTTPTGPGQATDICSTRCACPYNQALADFTNRLLPDLATLTYQHRIEGFPILPLVDLTPRRSSHHQHQSAPDKTPYFHVPVPGCCQKDSYLTLAVEIALLALGQQRAIPTIATAHDRAVRQETELISKLESIDFSDPMLMEILKHQTNLLLDGGPFQNTYYGIPSDSAPLHTFAKYLFESLATLCPQLAYKVGIYALKMPLLTDENAENFGAARTSPRSINHNHMQSEQLALAQAMLSRAKDEPHTENYLRRVFRASIKNIRNPTSLLKLSKYSLKEAKPREGTIYRNLLETAFDLGLHVLKLTREAHSSNTRFRQEAIAFIVECATDLGLEWVLKVMRASKEYFSPTEALSLVVCKDSSQINLRSQALAKLKPKEHLDEGDLSRVSRDLVLVCASLDPKGCALDALKFCESHEESLKKALKIITDAGISGTMKSSQLIEVADHIYERNMTDKAFEIALVAIGGMSTPSNSDNNVKNDIFRACEYAQKVNGFGILIPKLISNIDCAIVLSDIYDRFSPKIPNLPYRPDALASFGGELTSLKYYSILNSLNIHPDFHQQRADHQCWDLLLRHAIRAFIQTTRTRLQNISPRHYGEFIDFLVKAQCTFEKATNGPQQFKDLISEIMKSYRTKKKLMERLKARFDYPIKARI